MAGPLAKLYATLGIDAREFVTGIAQAKGQIGSLGTTASQGLRVAAGATAAGLAFAAKGALGMEDAQARFRAETGASIEEAQRFGQELNAMSGRSLVPMEELARASSLIRTDLGLTGDAASSAADDYERYMRATGQGADAVTAFDDILDAWNLEASEQSKIMDVLIKSHQEYGGSITDNQRLLAQLAPTLQAANMSWEEGQGLLNLFSRAGVGGEAAVTAFNRALSKVESPEQLQQLLRDISDMEDPFKRAQLAAEVFGNRAGTKLAQALSDAQGDLGRFEVTAVDAFGATEEAASALDSTISSQVKLAVNNGLALLRGFGMQAGPILTGAFSALSIGQMLGLDKVLGPALTKGWAAAAAKSKGAITAAGAAAGLIYAKAVVVGERILTAVSAAWAAVGRPGSRAVTAAMAAGGMTSASFVAGLIKGLSVVGIAVLIGDMINQALADAGVKPLVWRDLTKASTLDELHARATAGDMAQATVDEWGSNFRSELRGLQSFGPDVAAAISKGMDTPGDLFRGLDTAVRDQLLQVMAGMPGAVRESFAATRKAIAEGFGSVKAALADPPQLISRKDRIENMEGRMRKVFRKLRQAHDIDDPGGKRYWGDAAITQQRRLDQMRGHSTMSTRDIRRRFEAMGVDIEGTWLDTARQARDSSNRAKGAAVNAASSMAAQVSAILSGMDFSAAGLNAGLTFARGMQSAMTAVRTVAANLAQQVANFWQFSSPPKEGPLHSIPDWGMHMVEAWLSPVDAKGPARASKTAGRLAGALTMGGHVGAAAVASRGGGDTYQIGTLVATEGGLDQLEHRMSRRKRRRSRVRRLYNDVD